MGEGMRLALIPYQVGLVSAGVSAVLSIPMVFSKPTALWFNHHYVTTDVPEPRDLETVLEAGSWTWNWMEPPLGTFSFVLLCLQFCRAQIKKMGKSPYSGMIQKWRADRLA